MKLLLVEDEGRIAKALAEALQDRQYLVDLATDGQVGWNLIEVFDYDLILLDVMWPKYRWGCFVPKTTLKRDCHPPIDAYRQRYQ